MKRPLLIALALFATIAFAALGVWQVERLAWKRGLIAQVEDRLRSPPGPVPAASRWPGLDSRYNEYGRVSLTGTFLHDRETLVQAVTVHGAGYWVLTPIRTGDGTVLINRGFVPGERKQAREWQRDQGEVSVTGLMRATEPGGGFLRANDPAQDRWYSRDVAAIAAARKLGYVAPFFIDAGASPNPAVYPIGGLTVVAFRNNHLVYALTWFGLAGLSAFGAFMLLRRKPG